MIESWKKEFYHIPARKAAGDDLTAVEHSLKKWMGLRKENLDKHKVAQRGKTIFSIDDELRVSNKTCALCIGHLQEQEDVRQSPCASCPLYKVRGGYACDHAGPDDPNLDPNHYPYRRVSPFEFFVYFNDPEPMIRWLEKTKEFVIGGTSMEGVKNA